MKKFLFAVCFILLLSGCVEQSEELAENTTPIEYVAVETENVTPKIVNETEVIENETEEPRLYEENGRLTDYARSFRPEMFSLDFDELPKLHPEEYGNNYYEPGTYKVKLGDGFGKGDFLIKFVEFIPQNETIEGQVKFEVFRKENDGNYYHYPSQEDTIIRHGYTDIFGITIESPAYSWEINTEENTIIYHPNCTVYFDGSGGCSERCKFDTVSGETKMQNGKFSAIYPGEYAELASFAAALLEQCHNENVDFLGYDVEKSRVGIKVYLSETYSVLNGGDEAVTAKRNSEYLDSIQMNLDEYAKEKSEKRCIYYMRLSHELTHVMTKEVLGNNYGLNEGLAEFVDFHNEGSELTYVCEDDGWHYTYENITRPYANLSHSPYESMKLSISHYATGFCFWKEFTDEYGYQKFVLLMQELQQKGRGADDYYVLDVIEEVIGEPLPEEMLEKYSLARDATYTEICHNCRTIFLQPIPQNS